MFANWQIVPGYDGRPLLEYAVRFNQISQKRSIYLFKVPLTWAVMCCNLWRMCRYKKCFEEFTLYMCIFEKRVFILERMCLFTPESFL